MNKTIYYAGAVASLLLTNISYATVNDVPSLVINETKTVVKPEVPSKSTQNVVSETVEQKENANLTVQETAITTTPVQVSDSNKVQPVEESKTSFLGNLAKDLSDETLNKSFEIRLEGGITTGFGFAGAWSPNEYLTVRLGYSKPKLSLLGDEVDVDDASLSFKMSGDVLSANIDWKPFASKFYLTAGLAKFNNEIDLVAQPNDMGVIEINGIEYDAIDLGKLSLNLKYNDAVVPYVGFGRSPALHKTIGFFHEMGVYFAKPEARVAVENSGIVPQEDLDKLKKDLEKYAKFYPVAKIGLVFRF